MAASSQPGIFGAVPATQKRERRSCTRVGVLAELQQAVLAELGPTRGLLLDVCAGGISVEAAHAIEKGVRLPVSFLLPFDHDLFRASCEVAWENGGRAGLKFAPLSDAEQRQLGRWLDAYSKGAVASRTVAIEAPLPHPPQDTAKYDENYNPVGAASRFGAVKLRATSRIEAKITERDLPECDLARVTEEARSLTGADGAAIALRDEQGVLCRASTGNAPSVGLRLRAESRLTGECFRTGELVWCDDMDNDPRVDRAIAKHLQSRSALILPIRAPNPRGSTLGVIVVLSSRTSAFGYEHVATLHQLANQVGSAWGTTEAPPQGQSLTTLPQESVPGFVSNSPSATAKARLESFSLDTYVVDMIRRSLPALLRKRKIRLKKEISGPLLVMGLLLSLAAGASLLWWFFFHAHETMTAEQTHSASPQASETTARPLLTEEFPTQIHSTNEKSARRVTSAGTAVQNQNAPKGHQPGGGEATGPVRKLAVVQPQLSEAQALQLPLVSAGSLPELPNPASAPGLPPTSRIVPAQLVYRTSPVYPEVARRFHISGKVILKATITKNGTVGDVHWVGGNPVFRDSCISAIKQWSYKPANLNGQPVESDLEIVLQFGMSAR